MQDIAEHQLGEISKEEMLEKQKGLWDQVEREEKELAEEAFRQQTQNY